MDMDEYAQSWDIEQFDIMETDVLFEHMTEQELWHYLQWITTRRKMDTDPTIDHPEDHHWPDEDMSMSSIDQDDLWTDSPVLTEDTSDQTNNEDDASEAYSIM